MSLTPLASFVSPSSKVWFSLKGLMDRNAASAAEKRAEKSTKRKSKAICHIPSGSTEHHTPDKIFIHLDLLYHIGIENCIIPFLPPVPVI